MPKALQKLQLFKLGGQGWQKSRKEAAWFKVQPVSY